MPIEIIDADYSPSTFPGYRGNPLIETLPDFLSYTTTSLINDLRNEVPGLHAQASRRQRDHWLGSLACNLFIPISRHIHLQELIDLIVRQGYQQHPICGPEDTRRIIEAYHRQQQGEQIAVRYPSTNQGVPLSLSVVGCSGIGKTYSVTEILRLYPQAVRHPKWATGVDCVQIVYLRIECPSNGSVKALCAAIIAEIDNITGENFTQIYCKGRATAESLKSAVAHLLAIYHVGLLVIDEIQNLVLSRLEREVLFNFIVSLSNSLCVPLLFVGTPKIRKVMQTDLRISRRFGTLGTLLWEPIKKGSGEWRGFITELWRYNTLSNDDPEIPEEVEDALYDCSQGVTDILIKLFVLAQKYVLVSASTRRTPEKLTAKDIYDVYKEYCSPVHPMIDALRSNDPKEIERFEDVSFPKAVFDKASNELTELLIKATNDDAVESDPKIIAGALLIQNLTVLGVEITDKVRATIDQVLEEQGFNNLKVAMNTVLSRIINSEESTESAPPRRKRGKQSKKDLPAGDDSELG